MQKHKNNSIDKKEYLKLERLTQNAITRPQHTLVNPPHIISKSTKLYGRGNAYTYTQIEQMSLNKSARTK